MIKTCHKTDEQLNEDGFRRKCVSDKKCFLNPLSALSLATSSPCSSEHDFSICRT